MTDERGLGMTFDLVAGQYHEARTEYPDQLYKAMISAAGLNAEARLLEIGCATGKATLPLARGGFRITCVEPGQALVSAGGRNLTDFPDVEFVQSTFEDIDPLGHEPFDLVFAATSWHWLDPAVRYQHAWELLRPGGNLAFWSATHVVPEGGDPFFTELQPIYEDRRRPALRSGSVRAVSIASGRWSRASLILIVAIPESYNSSVVLYK